MSPPAPPTRTRHRALNRLPALTRNRNPTRDLCFNSTGSEGSEAGMGHVPLWCAWAETAGRNVPLVLDLQPLRAMPQMPHF